MGARSGGPGRSGEISRRRFLGLSAAGLGVAALGGCGGSGGDGGSGSNGSGGSQAKISFVHWRGEDQKIFAENIKKFKKKTGISVEQRVLPSNTDQYYSQIQSDLVAGSGIDVFATFPGNQFAQLAPSDVYVDLSDASFRDRFNQRFLEPGTYKGKQLAYPYQLVFNDPVYNKGLMEKNNVDPSEANSWEGFLGMCEKLKQGGVAPILFAGDISPSQFISPMMMNNMPSDDIWSKIQNGDAKVTEDWYVKTLSQIKELKDRGYYQEDVLGSTKQGVTALFAQEKGAMLALGSYMMATVNEQNSEIDQGLLAPITVPQSEKKYDGIYNSTFMLGISAKSKNKKAAKKWLDFLTQTEPSSAYANQTGQLLTLNEVNYKTEALKAQQPWLDKKTLLKPSTTFTLPDIYVALQTSVTDVLGKVPPEKAAAKLQGVIDRAIKNA